MRKMRLPVNLNEPTCRITESVRARKFRRSNEQNFLFQDYRDDANGSAQRERADVAHEHFCRMRVVPKEASEAPHTEPQKMVSSAAPGILWFSR